MLLVILEQSQHKTYSFPQDLLITLLQFTTFTQDAAYAASVNLTSCTFTRYHFDFIYFFLKFTFLYSFSMTAVNLYAYAWTVLDKSNSVFPLLWACEGVTVCRSTQPSSSRWNVLKLSKNKVAVACILKLFKWNDPGRSLLKHMHV